MSGVRSYIGLGSNLSDPIVQLRQARKALAGLPETCLLSVSSIYRGPPLYDEDRGTPDQPDFYNAVVALETTLQPAVLLQALLRIEQVQARVRGQRWGPRTLDLDLLLYGDEQIESADLTLPHPGLTQRAFVLYPLHEIDPGLHVPGVGPLATCLTRCNVGDLQRLQEQL